MLAVAEEDDVDLSDETSPESTLTSRGSDASP